MEGRGDSGLRNRSERGQGWGGGETVASGTGVRGGGGEERGDSGLWNRSERGQGWRGGETVASGTGVRGGRDGGEVRQWPLEQE